MRIPLSFTLAWLALVLPAPAAPDLLDRIAVRVGKDLITEGEVLDEIRITAFLNRTQTDFGPVSRRQAAERLVDQDLIRQEMTVSNYPEPEASQADRLLADFKKGRFREDAQYRAALNHYGISEKQLKEHLLWQLAALRFTDARFGSGTAQAPLPHLEQHAAARAKRESSAEASPPPGRQVNGTLTAARHRRTPAVSPADVDSQMDSWLKDARRRTSIQFFKEAFE